MTNSASYETYRTLALRDAKAAADAVVHLAVLLTVLGYSNEAGHVAELRGTMAELQKITRDLERGALQRPDTSLPPSWRGAVKQA